LNEKDKLSSKRGAFLYRFNEEKYKELISKGYDFTI
jgi:8-oxo-dGTP diphosphatase